MELVLENISIGYGARVLVAGLSETFAAGTLTALVGRNGTGKSTLLRVMAGLARPLAGEVIFRESGGSASFVSKIVADLSPRELARTVGFVSTERVRVTNLRVRDVVALGRTPYTDWIGSLSEDDRRAIEGALEQVGMGDFADKQLDTLSDGEAQRVMIARVLAQDTPVVLLDEPTAFLDFVARRQVVELLAELAHRAGKTVVFSSHELELVDELADKKLVIRDS